MFALVLAFFVCLPLFPAKVTEEAIGYGFSEGKAATTIPFRSYRNLIVISVQLNDTLNLNLILDTGTRSLILFGKKIGKLTNIATGRKIKINGRGTMKSVDANFSYPNKIKIGDVIGRGIGAAVLKESDLVDVAPGIDGIIGYELFVRFCIQIDYAKRIITLYDAVPEDTFRSFHSVNLDMVDQRPEIVSTIQTSRKKKMQVRTLIDTGSSLGLLVFANKKENFFTVGNEREIGTGLTGSVVGFSLGIFSYQLGDLQLFPHDCQFVPTASNKENELTVSASLGGDFLKDHVVMFHYASSQFFIKNKNV
jgi:hypothetical protein